MPKEAMFWEPEKDNNVHCKLCYRDCHILPDKFGNCGIRKNVGGKLQAMTYGKACAYFIDPIEKKPFYHFHPGEQALSVATVGCNFHCLHCCNPEISQAGPAEVPEFDLPPEKIIQRAKDQNINILAYTYTEPTVFYEYAYDTGVLGRKEGMLNTFVTNGYAQTEPINKAAKDFLDAARIDLKGDEKHYKEVCGNIELEKVLKCIKDYYKTGMHIEIITLVIPGDNDNKDFVVSMADFLKDMSAEIPWHFIRFFPAYKMLDTPPTEVKTLENMRDWAMEAGMKYVYSGNVPGHEYDNTYCHNCGELLIERHGFQSVDNKLEKGAKCPKCGTKIPVVL